MADRRQHVSPRPSSNAPAAEHIESKQTEQIKPRVSSCQELQVFYFILFNIYRTECCTVFHVSVRQKTFLFHHLYRPHTPMYRLKVKVKLGPLHSAGVTLHPGSGFGQGGYIGFGVWRWEIFTGLYNFRGRQSNC